MDTSVRLRAINNALGEAGNGLTAAEFEEALRAEGYTVVPQKLLSKLLSCSFKYLCIMRKR